MLSIIPRWPRWLGLAGLLPMAALLLAVLVGGPQWRWSALALGWGYAVLIFSFLGGLWWGLAAAQTMGSPNAANAVPGWLWFAAVLPSLLGLLTLLPWLIGDPWPGPSLVWLGIWIGLSPFVDRRIVARGIAPPWWLSLRIILSFGLGGMAIAMGLAA